MSWAQVLQGATSFGSAAHNAGSFFDVFSPIQRAGGYWANGLWPNLCPTPDQIMKAWNAGMLPDERARALLRMNGIFGPTAIQRPQDLAGDDNLQLSQDWQAVNISTWSVPAPGELLTLLNRNIIDRTQFDRFMRVQGYNEPIVRRLIEALRYEIPGPSDLVSFALKEAWDLPTVRAFGYDEEFPLNFQYWMEKQGYGGDANPQGAGFQQEPGLSWAKLYWRVHWQNLAPTQAYEMFQRLRPSRVNRFQQTIPGVGAFSLADLQQVLKINDYPQPFRDRLAAIAYRVPRLSDLEHFFELGLVDDAELYELHLDLGYDPTSARQRTNAVKALVKRRRFLKLRLRANASILNNYELGVLLRTDAAKQLYIIQITGTPAEERFKGLDGQQQLNEAIADAGVAGALADVDARWAHAQASDYLKSIHRKYMQGLVTPQAARLSLSQAGFLDPRIGQYLNRWNIQQSGGTVMLSARKIQKYYRYGMLAYTQAFSSLTNLGYNTVSAAFLLQETQRDITLDKAKADAAVAKDAKSRQKALETAAKAAKAQLTHQVADLVKQASKGDLKRYYTRGIIDIVLLRRELLKRGLVSPYLDEYIADAGIERQLWIEKRQKAAAAAQKAAGGSPSGTNGTAPKSPK